MLARLLLVALVIATAPSALGQSTPPDVLPDSVRQHLQVELREMKRTDQRVRTMYQYGTFSPCTADSLETVIDSVPSMAEAIPIMAQLRAEADARTSDTEKVVLRQMMWDADATILARLQEVIAEHGWPSDERVGADVGAWIFLMHSPHAINEMRPALLAEVRAGRMPAIELANVEDKWRKVNGELQLYGTGDEYDAETETIQPPRVADIDATNAARREIGLPPLEAYRLAD